MSINFLICEKLKILGSCVLDNIGDFCSKWLIDSIKGWNLCLISTTWSTDHWDDSFQIKLVFEGFWVAYASYLCLDCFGASSCTEHMHFVPVYVFYLFFYALILMRYFLFQDLPLSISWLRWCSPSCQLRLYMDSCWIHCWKTWLTCLFSFINWGNLCSPHHLLHFLIDYLSFKICDKKGK